VNTKNSTKTASIKPLMSQSLKKPLVVKGGDIGSSNGRDNHDITDKVFCFSHLNLFLISCFTISCLEFIKLALIPWTREASAKTFY
jgi:hypothetical protein